MELFVKIVNTQKLLTIFMFDMVLNTLLMVTFRRMAGQEDGTSFCWFTSLISYRGFFSNFNHVVDQKQESIRILCRPTNYHNNRH